jgi:hypothetical protein
MPDRATRVLDRARDENVPGAGQGRNPCSDDDREPGQLVARALALARVDSGAHVEPEIAHAVDDRAGAANRTSRSVEAGEEPGARGVELRPAKALELPADQRVVPVEEIAPHSVSELGCTLGRPDEVGEEERGENAVGDLRLC